MTKYRVGELMRFQDPQREAERLCVPVAPLTRNTDRLVEQQEQAASDGRPE